MQILTAARQTESKPDSLPVFLWRLARQSRKANTLHDLGRNLEYVGRLLPYWHWLSGLRARFADARLQPLLQAQPTLLDRVRRPYQDRRWGVRQRYEALISHYDWLLARFDTDALARIYQPQGSLLAELHGAACCWQLRLLLDRKFDREGELVLALFAAEGQRLATLAFTVTGAAAARSLRIGGLQGDKAAGQEAFRQFTKDCHGLRPLAFLLAAAQDLAAAWGCAGVLAISHDQHVYQHWRYRLGTHRVTRVYDALWEESGGLPEQGWYRLPAPAPETDPAAAPSNKRAMYRRRQTMLARLRVDLASARVV